MFRQTYINKLAYFQLSILAVHTLSVDGSFVVAPYNRDAQKDNCEFPHFLAPEFKVVYKLILFV